MCRKCRNEFSLIGLAFLVGVAFVTSSCGPKAFTKGEYDDPTRVELLDDKFNEADMQQMAETVVKAITGCESVVRFPKPPVVIVDKVQNRTEEHIDTVSLTDKIRTALIKSGKVRFVNKEIRETIKEEVEFHGSGNVDPSSAKAKGKQIGADYLIGGALATNVQQVGNDKFVYYKLTMNLTNISTSAIDCVEEKEVRKKYRKRSVGL